MSLPKLKPENKSRYKRWREKRRYGEAIPPKDVKKVIDLNLKLREDGKKLGIPQVVIEIATEKYEPLVSAATRHYRIKGDGLFSMPDALSYDYRVISKLSGEELRSIAWHEMGHYIFSYYFPDIDDKYWSDYDSYLVVETFADEFAYKKFGNTYVRAMRKLIQFQKPKDMKDIKERFKDLDELVAYRKKYRQPYWMELAKELNIEVKYNPKGRKIVGVRPKKSVLRGLYKEE